MGGEAKLCRSDDRAIPRCRPPRSERTAAGSCARTSRAAPRPPHRSVDDVGTAQTPLQSGSQKPPIASSSAASLPPEQAANMADNSRATKGGQMIRCRQCAHDSEPYRHWWGIEVVVYEAGVPIWVLATVIPRTGVLAKPSHPVILVRCPQLPGRPPGVADRCPIGKCSDLAQQGACTANPADTYYDGVPIGSRPGSPTSSMSSSQ